MAYYNGKEGRWITTETGRHVFIPDGQTVKQALADAFDEEESMIDDGYEPEFDPDDVIPIEIRDDEPEPQSEPQTESEPETIKDGEYKEQCLKSFRGIWDAPNSYVKNKFKDSFMRHDVVDKELEDTLFDMLKQKNNIRRIWIKTEYTGGGTYYNKFSRKLVMNISDNPEEYRQTMNNLFHEMGHGLDNDGRGQYLSSNYVSKKHGVTLADMVKEEMQNCDIENLISEYKKLENRKDQMWQEWKDGKITYTEYKNEKARFYYGAALSICDIIQGTYGIKYVQYKLGNWTHPAGYFDMNEEKYPHSAPDWNKKNRGTEFFAEMTEGLVNDHENILLDTMKKYTPKTVEIYFEILKEKYGYERK